MKTFGDSTKTPGQYVDDRCYILAQFPETTNLEWARELRAALGGGELKYQKYLGLRHKVQADRKLWKRVQDGTAEATIVVIENSFYINAIAYRLSEQGADLGHDVNFDAILRQAALCMIDHTPIMRLPDLIPDLLTDSTVSSRHYSSEIVYGRIGAKFNDAAVFAVRAHAAFDVDGLSKAASTNELFLSPFRRGLLAEVEKIDRVFDEEHPKSAAMLNEIFRSYDARSKNAPMTRVSESRSDTNDWLQAADFCAGFASEIMMNATDDRERELRRHVRKVIFNGATRS
jgi:hypothetical protein